jgi:hypothetical protein
MTQKDILESVLHEQMQLDMNDLKEDISEMKYTLLNPENGVIVNTNKNTEYRVQLQANQKEFDEKMLELENIKRWRDGVNRALWIIFGSLLTIIVRMIMMHSDKI